MKVRGAMILTGIVSSILGALVVYLVLSVPNDLRADAMLKQARQDITDGNTDQARQSLLKTAQNTQQTRHIAELQRNVTELQKRPPPVVTVQAPAPKPAPAKVTLKKKAPAKKPLRRRR
jgi:hypothetical protein